MRLYALILTAAAAAGVATVPPAQAQNACAPAGEWTVPGGKRVAAAELLAEAARTMVVLLGEAHDNADHHRWQLQTIASLAAMRGKVVLGFESFPRRVQGALDRWVAGKLGEQEFLAESDWRRVWNFDPQLYLPIFHFARINRIRMLALNVEADLVRSVNKGGLDAVPPEKREGVGNAAPASEAYLDRLFAVYAEHVEKGRTAVRADPEFRRFVESQLLWDRAMAQAIAESIARDPQALVIGIMGHGHVARGHGVPHQLASLGVARVTALLPWNAQDDCRDLLPGFATAVFGLPEAQTQAPRPRLGIGIEPAPDGVRVTAVNPGSLAEATGLRPGDVLVEAAGTALKSTGQLQAIVGSAAPGTWLPLKARRQDETLELLAKFPAARQ
jgi:uncharacterized iron-regulated protein